MRINYFVFIAILVVALSAGCTKTKEYHHVFSGESENWIGELVENGEITFKDHKELDNQYEIKYSSSDKLTIKFKGEISELGDRVEFSSVETGTSASRGPAGINGEWTEKEFTASGGGGGVTHIPKNMEFLPVHRKDQIITVNVKWGNNQEEKIKLSFKDK